MSLNASDLRRLRGILDFGSKLERASGAEAEVALDLLQKSIAALETEADSEALRRLAFHSRNLSNEMTAKHLAAILVPFERLMGKALRDDEFLVSEVDQFEGARQTAPLTVIADNIRSAFNVGAIFRTSEAFGAERVILTGYTSSPLEERTSKTSMGTEKHIEWMSEPSAAETVLRLKSEGYGVVALETAQQAEELGAFAWPEKCALILGNERFGVDPELLAVADHIVRIPLHGRKNSLNVGIALGVALADWRRQLARPQNRIGLFHSPAVHPYEARRQGVANVMNETAIVELDRGQGFEQALKDLDGFERIWLIYEFHHNANWKPMVMPPRGPRTKRGVFATRSPHRPRKIGMSCVELTKVEGLKLFVRGFDLLDQTPILDIKPYLPYADSFPNAKAGWTENLEIDSFRVGFSEKARLQLHWLARNGVNQIEGFICAQLEYDPIDSERKRVRPLREFDQASEFELSYRTWRVDFSIQIEAKRILVKSIRSGYSPDELLDQADLYGDKTVHKAFAVQNFD